MNYSAGQDVNVHRCFFFDYDEDDEGQAFLPLSVKIVCPAPAKVLWGHDFNAGVFVCRAPDGQERTINCRDFL